MDNYYEYFAEKGNHPDKHDVLKQEESLVFCHFNKEMASKLIENIIAIAKNYHKSISARIIYEEKMLSEYHSDNSWLERKEKVCLETKHSSYYAFLDNMDSHQYDYMIHDESYGICGGSFPLIVNQQLKGTITVSGLRPNEDHDVVVAAIKKYKEEKKIWKRN
ncbi:heme-binding protein [[Clostridium] spiroforme]|nr:heme-binding protein [Thomasclavelia spiroformis]